MKQYFGNYVGIVVQNNDPDKTGKVKVFVPHVTATVYKKWVSEHKNKKFRFLGANIDSTLTQAFSGGFNNTENLTNIVEELKIVLPWAECAAPLTSEDTSGRYNNYFNFANISDSNYYSTFSQSTSSAEDTPGKPGAFYEKEENRLGDAFTNAANNINNPNPLAYEYVPSTYSNKAKGSFGIPAVGSHVWVFFRDGNPAFPVYFATTFGKADWKGIYESYTNPGLDYPGTFENKNQSYTEYNNNVETYRNKYVINQKGGTIEIANSDLNEKIKFTHYSGSFKEFNNQANVELATNNDQKLVLNDSYSTVRGFKNEFTGKSLDEIILRDKYKKIGNLNSEYFEKWKELYAPVQDNKQLFEIQRTNVNNVVDSFGNVVIKRNSLQQTQAGTYAQHPSLNQLNYSLESNSALIPEFIQQTGGNISNSVVDGPSLLFEVTEPALPKLFPNVVDYTKESGIKWPGPPGLSTSSENGKWLPDLRKDRIKEFTESILPELTEIEKNLGIGGSEVIQITKHKIETIGMTINDYGSIRFDPIGKMLSSELLIDDNGTYINYEPSPMIELTHVQDLPGGDYTLNVCNRFNVMVGAGGLNLKSLGATNITGTVTNLVGEQVNVSSQNEINLNGKTINISAEILRLRNTRQKQIFIENSLGVNNNLVVGGGLSVEGEVFLQHVTAPTEYQVTLATQVLGKLLAGLTFEANINLPGVMPGPGTTTLATVALVADSNDNFVQCYDHSHIFRNLPLTLTDKNSEVRSLAKDINQNDERVIASRRVHGYK
jgi:hypothetical protein